MKYPNPKMLLRIAQADAYCMATEYTKLPRDGNLVAEALRFEKYLPHPTHGLHKLRPGKYTDDTQMSIGVAETLLEFVASPMAFTEAFVRCFKRDPRDGYARGFQGFLESVKDANDFKARILNDSDKNGAAMRAVPIGVVRSPEQAMAIAGIQAQITHNTADGIVSAQAVALMSHFALYSNSPLKEMGEWCGSHLMGFQDKFVDWKPERVMPPSVAIKTVAAAYRACQEPSLLDALRYIIQLGGDTDTVAAITWGVMSTRFQDEELASFWYDDLEGGPFGKEFLERLGTQLMDKFQRDPYQGAL